MCDAVYSKFLGPDSVASSGVNTLLQVVALTQCCKYSSGVDTCFVSVIMIVIG